MLKLDTKTLEIEGVTIYSDHADPNQFWYHEGPVALAERNGVPQFTLTTYRPDSAGSDASGGGFLTMEVDLKLDTGIRDRIRARLGSLAEGDVRLAPIPYDEGTVKLIALDRDSTDAQGNTTSMVEMIMGASKPALAGRNNAVFSIKLSQQGAILMQSVFKQGGSHVGVIYDLKYTALRPSIEVNIRANYKRIYDHLSMGVDFSVGVPLEGVNLYLEADIDFVFEKLKEDGVIEIEVTNFSTENDRAGKETYALSLFKEMLKEKWFEPSLAPVNINDSNPPTPPGTTRPPVTTRPPTAGTTRPPAHTTRPPVAVTTRPPVAGTTQPPSGHTTPAPVHPAPSPGLPPAAPPSGPGTPPSAPVNPPAGPPSTGESISNGSVVPANTAEGLQTPSLSTQAMGVIGISAGFKLKKVVQVEDKTLTVSYHRSDAVKRNYAPQGMIGLLGANLGRAHFIEVDMDDDFFRQFDISLNTGADFSSIGLAAAELAVEYGRDTDASNIKRKDFRFAAGGESSGRASFFVNASKDLDYAVSGQYHFDPGSDWTGEKFSYEIEQYRTSDRTLLVNPYNELGFLKIRIVPGDIDAGMVSQTNVLLRYEDGGGWSAQQQFELRPGGTEQEWKLRLSRPGDTRYRYQLVHHLQNGQVLEDPEVETDTPVVTVNDPFGDALNIEFFPNYDGSSIRQLFIDVRYRDEANDYQRQARLVFSGDLPDSQTVRFARLNPDISEFSFQMTILGKDNSVRRIAEMSSDQSLVFIGEHL